MAHHKLSLVVLAGFFAVGCGGAAKGRGAPGLPGSGPSFESQPAAPAPEQAGAEFEQAPPAPAPSAGAAAEAAPKDSSRSEPAAEERPGLGTSFGETRTSRVSSAPFVRENFDQPFAVATLFYNDTNGVRAMARRSGHSELGDASFHVARGALTVRLLDASGRPLQGLSAGGRSYVVGEDGERYIIQIKNQTRNRVEAVATVDGLDVVDGRAGTLSKRGYIIGPFATVEIDGFRRSFDEVATFRFGAVHKSYAAQKGNDRNVGVIGVAFFDEAGTNFDWTSFEIERRHDADPFPGRFASPPIRRF